VVGAGPIGSHLINFAKEQLSFAELYVSSPMVGETYKSKLFDGSHIIYKDSFGGLRDDWHKVVDCGILKGKFHSEKFNFLNKYFGQSLEFVPYNKRTSSSKKNRLNLLPSAIKITDINLGVHVLFSDGQQIEFDYVFICHGALPEVDLLVNSGLATNSPTISDHILLQSNTITDNMPKDPDQQFRIGTKGFFRRYEHIFVNDYKIKKTSRRHFGSSSDVISTGLIYAESRLDFMKQFFDKINFSKLLNATSLRYGVPRYSDASYDFYQFSLDDIYIRRKNNVLKVNKDNVNVIHEIRSTLCDDGLVFSGIHYHNTYEYLSPEISNRGNEKSRIILITPQMDYSPSCHHFTADLMRISEDVVMRIKQGVKCG